MSPTEPEKTLDDTIKSLKAKATIVLHASILVILTALTLMLGNTVFESFDEVMHWNNGRLVYTLLVFVFTTTIVFIFYMTFNYLKKSYYISKDHIYYRNAFEVYQNTIKTQQETSEILNQINTHKESLKPDFTKISSIDSLFNKVISDTEISLDLITTTRGLVSEVNSFPFFKLISSHLEIRNSHPNPFHKIRMIVPKNDLQESSYSSPLLALSTRFFVLKFFKLLFDTARERNLELDSFLSPEEGHSYVSICIKFFPAKDIFPAMHIWGNKKLVLLPSIRDANHNDLGETVRNLKFCYVYEESTKESEQMIKRSRNFFDSLYQIDSSTKIETWTLRNGKIKVENLNRVLNRDFILDYEFDKIEISQDDSASGTMNPRKQKEMLDVVCKNNGKPCNEKLTLVKEYANIVGPNFYEMHLEDIEKHMEALKILAEIR